MEIVRFILGDLQTNCYLLIKEKHGILIDPADDAPFLLEEIQRRNIRLECMLATHGHFDHVMAVGEIQLGLRTTFYMGKKDEFLVKRLGETAKHFLAYEPVIVSPKKINFFYKKNFDMENFSFQVIETPGHTPGGCSFYFPSEQIIFTGDTLFKGAVGRTDLSYSSANDLQKSLDMILTYPEETIAYPGHGDPTTIMDEKQI